jgi:RimJ/RimL family protein N-acetyltransferase
MITPLLHRGTETFSLRDGAAVTVRAIRPDDAPRLQELVSRLSPGSLRSRFLGERRRLKASEARLLAGVDHDTWMALVATRGVGPEEQVVAVARYATARDQPDLAEVALVVEDAYQGQGLGTFLARRLTRYARAHGVASFQATMYCSNRRMERLLQHMGQIASRRVSSGILAVVVNLSNNERLSAAGGSAAPSLS